MVLEKIFSKDAMERSWTKYVRSGLRGQEITDLHDYNDFHWGRLKYFDSLRSEIVEGVYTPRNSTPVRIEKSNGVTRTLVVPAVQDAIVLQCIVEFILDRILKNQPSKNSFFSRSHGFSGGEFSFDSQYIWFRRWRKFSNIRFKISSNHPFVCTTDIANYYDNIDYTHLRAIMSSVAHIEEVAMDIMFRVLTEISWRPDYLPPAPRSLPQVHFDAPRLLAHAYLYEVDEFLKEVSSDSFVRWVDDITVAVESREAGKALLRDLDQILMTRGLRLNAGKTKILSAKEAEAFFYKKENAFLDDEAKKIDKFVGKPGRLKILSNRLLKKFDKIYNSSRSGQWDKVVKRYFTLFTKLKSDSAFKYCRSLLKNYPSLRDSIWRYFSAIGPNRRIFDEVRAYVIGADALDDASVFQAANVIIEWPIIPGSKLHKLSLEFGRDIIDKKYDERSQFYFIAGLRIIAKYGLAKDMFMVLSSERGRWSNSEILARQVAAVMPKLRSHSGVKTFRRLIELNKFPSANSVIVSLDDIRSKGGVIPANIRMYVLNGQNATFYGIERFLIAIHVLLSKEYTISNRSSLKVEIVKYISDPIYLKVINSIKIT